MRHIGYLTSCETSPSVRDKHTDVTKKQSENDPAIAAQCFFCFVCFSRATHKQKVRELAAARVFIKGVTSGRAGVSKLRCNRGLLSRFRSFQKMFPTHPRLFPSSSSHSPLLSLLPSQAWSLHRGGGPKKPSSTALSMHCFTAASNSKSNQLSVIIIIIKRIILIKSIHHELICTECTFHQVAPITSNL